MLDQLARTRILAVLDTLEYVKRGGRIGGVRAFLGNVLSVKPIISLVVFLNSCSNSPAGFECHSSGLGSHMMVLKRRGYLYKESSGWVTPW